MGLYDRPYWKQSRPYGGDAGGLGGMRLAFPKPPRVVKYLLLINLGVFVMQLIFATQKVNLSKLFGVTVSDFWQVWRYVTFQFLHGGIWHIALNLLVLYMFGSNVERHWGERRFLKFYLSCGAAAGVTYAVMAALISLRPDMIHLRGIPLIGASGGGFGILLACAVLFPHLRVFFFFIPMSMRTAAIIIFGISILHVLGGSKTSQFWSDIAHLGGAGMAAVWLWVIPRIAASGGLGGISRLRQAHRRGRWERKMSKRRQDEAEIDRILQKIHDHGIASLSAGEKKVLQDATRRQQEEERNLTRL